MKNVRDYNVGKSDYAKHTIQPWDIILEYGLNYWDGDIIKRVLRTKEGDPRRLDYEKIIHICNERIRQIDAENDKVEDNETSVFCPSGSYKPAYSEVGRMFDDTSVFCPSESYKPAFSAIGHMFDVYSVFEWGKHYYAYVGYDNIRKTHMYLCLTGKRFATSKIAGFPLPCAPFKGSLGNTEHSESVKIGALGVDYEKYDYLINDGMLYRYLGAYDNGIFFKYARFDGNFNLGFIEIPYQIMNEARQIVCRK